MVVREISLRCLLFSILALLIGVCFPAASLRADERTGVVEPKQAVRRVALVIGNGGYVHVAHLVNPLNDAANMAKLFTDAGFETVEAKTDLGITSFNRVLADFEVSARGADVAIVYYSGHGIEYAGQNYLIPVDAAMQREVDVKYEAVPLDHVLATVAGATRLKLVILDACRTDPFKATSGTKSVNRGLAAPETKEVNELVAYSARAGTAAADGDPGGDSPYTAALLKRLTTPGLDVELALRRVRDDVLTATHREQEPFYYGSMGGDELPLVAKNAEAPAAPPPAAGPQPAAGPVKDDKVVRLEAAPDPAVGECDRLASSPFDAARPAGIAGVAQHQIDAARAVPACRAALAAAPADPRIAFQLARALGQAGGPASEEVELYRKAANAGHLGAMTNLGNKYLNGSGVSRDVAEAVRWYRKAADSGYPPAINNLGKAYAEGSGVPRDPVEAVRWYRRAAEAGEAPSMTHLGYMYETGAGVPKDAWEAARWYRKAANAGDPPGMTHLGFMYETGEGVTKDPSEAVRWYSKAADAGHALGMSNLGFMYEKGEGVARDPSEAVRWYRKAADLGNALAMNNLGVMYLRGTGVAREPSEAVRWYRKSADAGNALGMNNLGSAYERGEGVPKDPAEALSWYLKAADAGSREAEENLIRLAHR